MNDLGSGRLIPTLAAALALTSVIIAVLALTRPAHRRTRALAALAAALIALLVGGLHVANSAGGLGTGNGLAGAVVAVVLALIGAAAATLALIRRSRA